MNQNTDVNYVCFSNLSDEDDNNLLPDIVIEDLDPDLAALTHSIPGSSAQPEKIVVKLQYTHNFNFENLSDSAKRSIQFLEKPIKFKVMDVGALFSFEKKTPIKFCLYRTLNFVSF